MIKFELLPADIFSRIPNLKRVLLEDENIIFAYLFGGLARGELKPLSDVDIAKPYYLNSALPQKLLDIFSYSPGGKFLQALPIK